MKSGKAAAPDGIPPKALKADPETTATILQPLLHSPTDWTLGHLVKLPKKGDLSQCNNWQGIMLLSTPSKVLPRVILERLKKALDKRLRPEQAGFHQDRSCTDPMATTSIIIEHFTAALEMNGSWIGLEDLTQEDRFVWTTSQREAVYTNWARDEPSDSQRAQNCVWLTNKPEWQPPGGWDDGQCGAHFLAMCEQLRHIHQHTLCVDHTTAHVSQHVYYTQADYGSAY
ncbi:hypothetical protein C0Q70_08632 [Pomacea canaliculata]|uniref:C-type lectin domain-containing protein n=1 Tax=Pomacea canaliculata TaxID=400727 RepID=A0A2T7P7J6_POMCA|nr:hypothetical protein C0Q70_08632 [Pomacea canaliculata]